MTEYAELTLKVNTSDLKKADADLKNFARTANKVEKDIANVGRTLSKSTNITGSTSGINTQIQQIMKSYSNLYREMAKINSAGLGTGGINWLAQVKAKLGGFPKFINNLTKEANAALGKGLIDPKSVSNNLKLITDELNKVQKHMETSVKTINAAASGGRTGGITALKSGAIVSSSLSNTFAFGDRIKSDISAGKEYLETEKKLLSELDKQGNNFNKKRLVDDQKYKKQLETQDNQYYKVRDAALNRIYKARQVQGPASEKADAAAYAKQPEIAQQLMQQSRLLSGIHALKERIVGTKDKIIDRNQKITGTIWEWTKGVAKGLGLYLTLYGVGLLIMKAWEMWLGLIKEAIDQIDDLRTQIYSSAAMMTSLSVTATPTAEVYEDWKTYFDWLYRASLAADRKVAASGKEIFKVAQETAYRGVVATTEEQVLTLGRLTDTIKLVTRGIGHQEWQIYQEIRNLFLGSEARLMGAQLLQRLKQIDPEVQKTIGSLQKMRDETGDVGPLFEYINKLLEGMGAASEDLAKTWGSLVSTSQGAWQLLMVEAFGNAYDEIVKVGWQLLDIIYKNGQLTATGKILGDTLSRAWSMVSKYIKTFADELEKNPEKLIVWVKQFIDGITQVTKAFIGLVKAILYVPEAIQKIRDAWGGLAESANKNAGSAFGGVLAGGGGIGGLLAMFGVLKAGDLGEKAGKGLVDLILGPKKGQAKQKSSFVEQLKEDLDKLSKEIESGKLGDFTGKVHPLTPFGHIKEDELKAVLDKIQDAYLDFSKTATKADQSVWSNVINFQKQSLEKVKDIAFEYTKVVGFNKNALDYEKQLLDVRRKAVDALVEGVKLEYREYLTDFMDETDAILEKRRIEEEKAKRKWELPPEIKQINTYADTIESKLLTSGKQVHDNIKTGCEEGGMLLIEASEIASRNMKDIFKGESKWGRGGSIEQSYASDLKALASETAKKFGVDPALARALVQQESGWNPNAVSPKGAMGLTQLMPGTAAALGVKDPFNAAQNLEGGIKYLKQQIDKFGDVVLGLAAYNAGPGNVEKYGGIPPFNETRKFVSNILSGSKAESIGSSSELSEAIGKILSGAIKASNCGDQVALAMNSTIGDVLPRGGITDQNVKSIANKYGSQLLNRESMTKDALQSLGPGTVIFWEKSPGEKGYKEGVYNNHAEMTALIGGVLKVLSWKPEGGAFAKDINENYFNSLPAYTIATNPYSKNVTSQIGLPVQAGIQGTMNKTSEMEQKELAAQWNAMRNKPLELIGQSEKRVEDQLKIMDDRLNKEQKYIDLMKEATTGTKEQFYWENESLKIAEERNKFELYKKEYKGKDKEDVVNRIRVAQLLAESEKRITNMKNERIFQLEKENLLSNKLLETTNNILSIEGVRAKEKEGFLMKSLALQEMIKNKELELFIINNKITDETTQKELRTLQEINNQIEKRAKIKELEKQKLAEGGLGEGFVLWGMNREEEAKTRTSAFVSDIMQEMESATTNAVMNIIKKGAVGFREFGEAILDAITNKAVNYLVNSLFDMMGKLLSGISSSNLGGSGGFFSSALGMLGMGGGGKTTGSFIGAVDMFPEIGGMSFAMAKGGILPGHFIPFHAFADGGVTNSPLMGLIGEAGPEAVIPLQGGAIPVQMNSAPQEQQTTIINVLDPSLIGKISTDIMRSNIGQKIIVNSINKDVYERGSTSRTMRGR